jgi:hypothetical protein
MENNRGLNTSYNKSEKGKNANGKNVRIYNLALNNLPFIVEISSFDFNDQVRYYVNVNASDDYVFAWDSQVGMFRPLDDRSDLLPDGLIEAISSKIQTQAK